MTAPTLISNFPYAEARDVQTELLEMLETNWLDYDVFVVVAPTACHAPGQGVIMYDGTIKVVEYIKVGDLLMGPDSTPRKVLNLHHGKSEMVTVTPKRGNPHTVTWNHILSTKKYITSGRYDRPGGKRTRQEIVNIQASDWMRKSKHYKHCSKLWKPDIVEFEPSGPLPIDPYILGCWLGDGHSDASAITTMDSEIVNSWEVEARSRKLDIRIKNCLDSKADTYFMKGSKGTPNSLLADLRNLNLYNNKHIPHQYLTASSEDRRQLMAGLMDTDGSFDPLKRSGEITQKRETLANDILFLLRSLGYAAQIGTKEIKGKVYYRVTMSGTSIQELPLRISRKQLHKNSKSNQNNTGFVVEPAGFGEYYGFELDGDHLYLLDDFTVTHNSGKSPISICIANWLEKNGGARILVPNNMLVQQYADEYAGLPTLLAADREGLRGNYNWSKQESWFNKMPVGVCTYHMQSTLIKRREGWKANRQTLIIDEAHNLLPFLQDLHAQKFWEHKMGDVPVDSFLWKLSPELHDDVFGDKPKYVLDTEFDTWRAGWTDKETGIRVPRGEEVELPKLVLKPVDVSNYPETLWPKRGVSKVVLLSATIGEKDIERMGLNKRRVCYLQCRSPIPVERRPVYLTGVSNVVKSRMNDATEEIAKEILRITDEESKANTGHCKGFIHATYEQALLLKKHLAHDSRYIFHDREDKESQFRKWIEQPASSAAVLIGSGMYEGVDMKGEIASWQGIAKIPYLNLGSPAVKYLAESDEAWYIWETLKQVMQACGRVCRTPTDFGKTYVLDSQMANLVKRAEEYELLPQWFKEALIMPGK